MIKMKSIQLSYAITMSNAFLDIIFLQHYIALITQTDLLLLQLSFITKHD